MLKISVMMIFHINAELSKEGKYYKNKDIINITIIKIE